MTIQLITLRSLPASMSQGAEKWELAVWLLGDLETHRLAGETPKGLQ